MTHVIGLVDCMPKSALGVSGEPIKTRSFTVVHHWSANGKADCYLDGMPSSWQVYITEGECCRVSGFITRWKTRAGKREMGETRVRKSRDEGWRGRNSFLGRSQRGGCCCCRVASSGRPLRARSPRRDDLVTQSQAWTPRGSEQRRERARE